MPLTGPELQDRGLHLRGIVQMMAVDRVLDAVQRAHIQAWAAEHGFDAGYVDASIDSVFENRHFLTAPPRFSSRTAAEAFLREAALVAVCDGEFHPQEREWLLAAAASHPTHAQAWVPRPPFFPPPLPLPLYPRPPGVAVDPAAGVGRPQPGHVSVSACRAKGAGRNSGRGAGSDRRGASFA